MSGSWLLNFLLLRGTRTGGCFQHGSHWNLPKGPLRNQASQLWSQGSSPLKKWGSGGHANANRLKKKDGERKAPPYSSPSAQCAQGRCSWKPPLQAKVRNRSLAEGPTGGVSVTRGDSNFPGSSLQMPRSRGIGSRHQHWGRRALQAAGPVTPGT